MHNLIILKPAQPSHQPQPTIIQVASAQYPCHSPTPEAFEDEKSETSIAKDMAKGLKKLKHTLTGLCALMTSSIHAKILRHLMMNILFFYLH